MKPTEGDKLDEAIYGVFRDIRVATSRDPQLRASGGERYDITACLFQGAYGSAVTERDVRTAITWTTRSFRRPTELTVRN
jgi:hypothetical protein